MKFQTKIQQSGKNITGIVVPPKVVEKLAAGKKPPVYITVNKYTYRSTVAVMGGNYMVPLSAEHRNAAGVEGGQLVTIDIELDKDTREVAIPADFKKVLSSEKKAKDFFDKLSYSNQKRIVTSIIDAKTEDTRKRRIINAIELLNEGKK